MSTVWVLNTDGKPLVAIRSLLKKVWLNLGFDLMVLPLRQPSHEEWATEVIVTPDELERANPFTPIMNENIAARIPKLLKDNLKSQVGALLRPCETRALRAISINQGLDLSRLTIISTECLGTYPRDEFSWRSERPVSSETIEREVLKFSKQGGISEYRFRLACQLCKDPIPTNVDLAIKIVGLPVRRQILLEVSEKLKLEPGAGLNPLSEPEIELTLRNNEIAEKIRFRHRQTNARLSEALVEDTGLDLDSLHAQLNSCGDCTTCMAVCPICTGNRISRDKSGQISREILANWMISCVGCGMCEQACSQHKPLSAIFGIVREQLSAIRN